MNEEKISRICWNTNNWEKPSGKLGKSPDKKSYENQIGFGHEEWLFDVTKIINGYHYGFIQTVENGRKVHQNKVYNISFYTINCKSSKQKEWLWIGKINNVHIISQKESNEIKNEYKKNGWFKEMHDQLKEVDVNIGKNNFEMDFCVKFKISDFDLLPIPFLKILPKDKSITSTRYVLLSKNIEPTLDASMNGLFMFNNKHIDKKISSISYYVNKNFEIKFPHNEMSDNIRNQLSEKYGAENVGPESHTGYGTKIDICLKDNNSYIFFELKTRYSVKQCIREALGQLIEYSYYPNKTQAKKLIIVSPYSINNEIIEYLKHIRKVLCIPLYYMRYDIDSNSLDWKEY